MSPKAQQGIAVSIAVAREMLGGIANATIYKLIEEGKLRTFCIGRRRLVGIKAIEDYVAEAERDLETSSPMEGGADAR
jgi:excisionase family DNA binding protein